MLSKTTITAIQGVFISSAHGDSNYSTQDGEALYIGSFKNSSDVFRALLQFNLNDPNHGIPVGSTIQTANLVLYLYRNDNVGTARVDGFKLLDAFDQYVVTYNSEPSSNYPTSAVVGGAVTPSGTTGTVSLDITPLVKEWYDGSSSNVGIELRGLEDVSDNILAFRSARYPDSRYWPALEVKWAKGTESPTVTNEFAYNVTGTSTPISMTGQDQVSFIIYNNTTGGTLVGDLEISLDGVNYFADAAYHFTGLAAGASTVINYDPTAAEYVRINVTSTGSGTAGTYAIYGKTKAD